MKLQSFLICDDVRQEIGNKFTLVGLYNADIKLNVPEIAKITWPIAFNLAFYLRVLFEAEDASVDAFNVAFSIDNKIVANVSGQLNIEDRAKPAVIIGKLQNFPISPGMIKTKILFKSDNAIIKELDPGFDIKVTFDQTQPEIKKIEA